MTLDLQALLAQLTLALAPSTPDRMNYGFPIQLTQAEARVLVVGLTEAERERDEARDAVVLWKTIAESAGNHELAMTAERDAALPSPPKDSAK